MDTPGMPDPNSSPETPRLHGLLTGELHYLNRAGFAGQIAPLLRKLEFHTQVLLWTDRATLEAFRAAHAPNAEAVTLPANDWRGRAEFLESVASQHALEIVIDAQHVYRTGEAMLEVEAEKTLTACL